MSAISRTFSDAKVVDGRALNLAGVQPFRAVLARTIYNLRRSSGDPLATELARNGYVMVEDFLPPDVFADTVREAADYVDETLPRWLHENGTTVVRQFLLAGLDDERYPHLARWRTNDRVQSLASSAERRPVQGYNGGPLIEDISLGDYSEVDPQTRLHVDTMFNTHKVWLYLDDVHERNAPLVYVPRSHQLDRARLREEYRDASAKVRCQDPSRRVADDEVARRGLEPRSLPCPKNTLVIANTCGYHARAIGEPGESRRALHLQFRFNPFWYPMPRARRTLGAARRLLGAGRGRGQASGTL